MSFELFHGRTAKIWCTWRAHQWIEEDCSTHYKVKLFMWKDKNAFIVSEESICFSKVSLPSDSLVH